MKWIKASERLPEKNVCIRWPDESNDYTYSNSMAFESLHFIDGLEWLDETASDNKKEIERLKGLLKHAITGYTQNEAHIEKIWQQFKKENNL